MRHGFQIVQFGVDYFPRTRGVSTLSSPAVIVKILPRDDGAQRRAAQHRGGVKRQLLLLLLPVALFATACETTSEAQTAPSTEAPRRRLLP